jgi:hypothetical protein
MKYLDYITSEMFHNRRRQDSSIHDSAMDVDGDDLAMDVDGPGQAFDSVVEQDQE